MIGFGKAIVLVAFIVAPSSDAQTVYTSNPASCGPGSNAVSCTDAANSCYTGNCVDANLSSGVSGQDFCELKAA